MTEAVRRRLFAALLWTITALWLLLIWRMSAQTGEQSSGVSGRLAAWLLPGADARAHAALEPLLRKGAHMAEYAVLACLFSLSLQASRVPHPVHAALVCAVLSAALDECHQLFVPGRAGRVGGRGRRCDRLRGRAVPLCARAARPAPPAPAPGGACRMSGAAGGGGR